MDEGKITDTVLEWSAHSIANLSSVVFVNVMYWVEVLLSFFVPSSSGPGGTVDAHHGTACRPAGYQPAPGGHRLPVRKRYVNLVNPTFAVVMGGLAIGRVGYDRC